MGARQGGFNGRPHRRPYISPYRAGYPYLVAPGGGLIGPGYPGYPDALDYDDSDQSQAAANPDNGGYDNGYDSNGYGSDNSSMAPPQRWPALGPYAPSANQAQPPSAAASQDQQPVTLVFNDGRPPLKIYNYLLTPTTLFVQDGNNREIPLSRLDLTATAKANEDAGVEFKLPKALD